MRRPWPTGAVAAWGKNGLFYYAISRSDYTDMNYRMISE